MNYKWVAMFTVSVGVFMATLDGSIVNIALPTLTTYFSTDITTVEWVIIAYLLTITSLLLSIGRLSDIVGRKPVFALGFLVFTTGSLLCAIAWSAGQLIFFRVIQGTGAAMIMANGAAIVTHAFPDKERGRALGLLGSVVAIGWMAGPVLGGVLIESLSWRSIFYINVPTGIAGMIVVLRCLRKEDVRRNQKFDIPGAISLFIALISMLVALSEGQELGWGSFTIIFLFFAFAVFMVLFLIIENRARHPMIEQSLFRNRALAAASLSATISFISMFSVMLLMPFYLENVKGFSPAETGIILISIPFVMSLAAPASGWIADKTNSNLLSTTGIGISCASLLLLSFLNQLSTTYEIVVILAMFGLGMGLFQPPNSSIIMSSVPREKLGIAAGTMATMRNLGMVMGVAIGGAVFTNRFTFYNSFVPAFQDTYRVTALICGIGIITSITRGSRIKSGIHE